MIVSLENAKKETRKSPLLDFNEVAWTKHDNNNYITLRSDLVDFTCLSPEREYFL